MAKKQEIAVVPSNEITSAAQLSVRRLNAEVTVPLQELDAIRAEHAQAIKVAQAFEAQQGKVHVTLTLKSTKRESIRVPDARFGGFKDEIIDKDVYDVIGADYYNLTEVTGTIKNELGEQFDNMLAEHKGLESQRADKRIQDAKLYYEQQNDQNVKTLNRKIAQLESTVSNLETEMNNKSTQSINDRTEAEKAHLRANGLSTDLKAAMNENSLLKVELAKLTDVVENKYVPLTEEAQELKAQYEALKTKKSIWNQIFK